MKRIMSPRHFFFPLLLLIATAPAWGKVSYEVRIDAPAALASLLQDQLDLLNNRDDPELDEGQLQALLHDTPDEARKLLETEGYFHAEVTVQTESAHHYLVTVRPGEPVLVDDVTVRLLGPIRDEEDYQTRLAAVLEAWDLPMGAPFRQSDWDSSKRRVLRLLTVDRFPLAKLTVHQANIDPQTGRAQLSVDIDSGPRIGFGQLSVQGMRRYPVKVASGLADFHEGDGYSLQKLADYQSALEQAPHFSSAIVNADMSKIENNRVPVEVEVTEFPRQKLELGLTYDSEEGPGVRLGYDYYNIFRRGLTGSVLLDWKQNEQNVSFGLALPRQADGYGHSVTLALKDTDVQGVQTRALDTGIWRVRTRGKIEARVGLEYLQEREQVDGVIDNNTRALVGVFGWTRRDVDDVLRPRSGTLLDINLSGTLGNALSNTSYVRGYSRAAAYWTPVPRWGTWVGRLELGQVWAKDVDQVPSTRLFRAGGANSVRGYDYQSLGVAGPNGSVLGGRVLATASVEYQIPVARDWALALFSDAGNAARNWNSFQLERANGIGARWMSPLAPLSFDLAKSERDHKIRWHMSLGLVF